MGSQRFESESPKVLGPSGSSFHEVRPSSGCPIASVILSSWSCFTKPRLTSLTRSSIFLIERGRRPTPARDGSSRPGESRPLGSFRISSPVQARQRFPGCVRGRAGLVSRLPGASTSQEMAAYLSPLSRYRPIVPKSNGSAASINPHTRPMASGPTPVKSGFWMLNQFQKNRRPTNRKP